MVYIRASNLSIKFFRKKILEDVNFEISSGEKIGIIGENGAGKTTFVETLMGVNNARISGELQYFNGIEKNIKAVFQDYQFDKLISLANIYKYYALIAGVEPKDNLGFVFSKYGLQGQEKKYFHKLSGGEKQKFKLLMCLELQPKLIILDEVTTSLDFKWRKEIFKILNDFFLQNPDCSLILISHDPNEVQKLTTKQYLVANGTISLITNIDAFFAVDEEQFGGLSVEN